MPIRPVSKRRTSSCIPAVQSSCSEVLPSTPATSPSKGVPFAKIVYNLPDGDYSGTVLESRVITDTATQTEKWLFVIALPDGTQWVRRYKIPVVLDSVFGQTVHRFSNQSGLVYPDRFLDFKVAFSVEQQEYNEKMYSNLIHMHLQPPEGEPDEDDEDEE